MLIVIWAALGAAAIRSHAASSDELKVVAADTSSAPKVRITVAVPSALSGKQLPDSAFTVVESGKKRIPHISRIPTDARAVVLAIDTSGSMQGAAIQAARAAAISFVNEMPAGTRVAVVGFNNQPTVVAPFTDDKNALTAAISNVTANGETTLYDAIDTASSLLTSTGDARRTLVVLSDGGDTRSTATESQAEGALKAAATSFYAVSLVTTDSDPNALGRLADSSGGRVVSASDPAGLSAVYDALALEIANQYEFTFRALATGATNVQVGVDSGDVHATTSVKLDLPAPAPRSGDTAPKPAEVTTTSAPLFGGAPWALFAGAALFFGALTAGGLVLFAPRTPRSTISVDPGHRVGSAPVKLAGIVDSATHFAEETLERRGHRRTLDAALERAGIDMRPGEFIVLAASVAIGVTFFGLLLLGPIAGIVLGVVAALAFRIVVSIKAERRRQRFAEQLGDTLQLLAGSLRAGHGLLQAVDGVAEEAESPTREEFGRIVIETRFGQDLGHALDAAADRVGNEDFEWVVQAIEIHRTVGGDLAEVLDHVAATIRARNSIRRQVAALSAEGRLSAIILFVLPIALTALIAGTNSSYLNELLDTTAGNVLIGIGIALMLIGGFWMRRLVRLRF